MSNITLELEAGKLRDLTDVVTISDGSGRVLGRFFPISGPSVYEGVVAPIEIGELHRRRQERTGLTTAEVRDHLKGLESS